MEPMTVNGLNDQAFFILRNTWIDCRGTFMLFSIYNAVKWNENK